MGNRATYNPEETTDKPKEGAGFCEGICYAASQESKSDKLEPIVFSEVGSDCSSPKRTKEQSSAVQKGAVPKNELMVVRLGSANRAIEMQSEYTELEVKYSVIKLGMREKIMKYIEQMDPSFHKEQLQPHAKHWKLSPVGFYYRKIDEENLAIVTEDQFYAGGVLKGTMVPHKDGLYITEKGAYLGLFQMGVACGRGKYVGEKFRYEGEWKEGKIIEGSLETKRLRFQGKFDGAYPSQGIIIEKGSGTRYEGTLKDGKFDDKEGVYECDEYVYEGGFQSGKRQGYGELREKPIGSKRAPRVIKGFWKEDGLRREKRE